MNQHTPMVLKTARALCKRHAEICNVNEQDLWNLESENFIDDAYAALNPAGVKDLIEALRNIKNQSIGGDWTHEQAFNFCKTTAKAAIAKVEGEPA